MPHPLYTCNDAFQQNAMKYSYSCSNVFMYHVVRGSTPGGLVEPPSTRRTFGTYLPPVAGATLSISSNPRSDLPYKSRAPISYNMHDEDQVLTVPLTVSPESGPAVQLAPSSVDAHHPNTPQALPSQEISRAGGRQAINFRRVVGDTDRASFTLRPT